MKCPSDGTQLARIQLEEVVIDKCHQCDGIWLDHSELKQLRNSSQPGLEEDIEGEYGNPVTQPGSIGDHMRCPVCQDVGLIGRHISYFKPVKVDGCPKCHGMWLDDQELDALLEDKQEMNEELHSPGVMDFVKFVAGMLPKRPR
ncbi:MAG: zf-TFIIB domain-containing protein [Planctomycetota bacterium]|nr:zf-TFIIB domain-containing protein [Planctomycetota bacterium]